MSFENFPTTETPQQSIEAPKAKSNTKNIITSLLVAALLGTWGYIIYDKNKTKKSIED